tara:strand:+ start:1633 stop:2085 length:453 start_codon:yes stop_codon:yes gene_type:complete
VNTADVATTSAWPLAPIETYLAETALPCRLACVTDAGFPHVTSLWYLYRDGELLFSVQRSAMVSTWLAENPQCGFEVAVNDPPYRGVRGRGTATVAPATDDTVLRSLIDRFLGDDNPGLARWLLSRTATELTLRVRPQWLTAWDYGKRMA